MILKTERLYLSSALGAFRRECAALHADPDVMRYLSPPLSPEESDRQIDTLLAHHRAHGFGLMAVQEISSGEFLGLAGLMVPNFEADFSPCVEIGWRFRKESWGRGYATEAAAACLHYAFDGLRLHRIVSFTALQNLPSQRLMERLGLQRVAEFDHPRLGEDNPLRRHVLYEIHRP